MASTKEESTPMRYAGEQLTYRYPWCQAAGVITTVVGIATVIVIWAAAIGHLSEAAYGLGVYLLVIAIPISLLEFSWLINKCPPCCGQDGCICYLWRFMCWIDVWKRAIFYIAMSIPIFILARPFLSYLAAIILDFCGIFYLLKTWQLVAQPVYTKHATSVAAPTATHVKTAIISPAVAEQPPPYSSNSEAPVIEPIQE